ncbi:MAG TPA: RNA polymerase-associated protein RapA, partial [Chromatiaceae bacterium]|nr:RNA polymerase-associated protein RapA [Chromatiaceae bacterium]
EMLRRFNLRFSLFDAERFASADADNPFLEEQRVLCSPSFLLSKPDVARAALAGEWDMLVVDEAHHLHWTPEESSLEYDLVEALADQTLGCLLLSATPEQLGRAGHFARLRLLDPHRYADYRIFLEEETRYRQVAALAGKLLDGKPLHEDDRLLLQTLLGDQADSLGIDQQVRRLVDLHGTGRVLFRNTRVTVKGFPQRRLHPAPLAWPEPYGQIGDPLQALAPERQLAGWTDFDSRVAWLVELLAELAPRKVLLICAHAETVLELQQWLRERHAIHAAVFHEGMEVVERDRAAAFFADEEEGSQILLCSEIGSEGRNFQFLQHLLLFDLPLEPDLLEQRIGRLDRIGQGPEIHLHIPAFDAGPCQVLYRWYDEGLDAFSKPSAVASNLYERYRDRLLQALADPALADGLITEVSMARERLEVELAAGRDRLLELQSCEPEVASGLVEQVRAQEQASALGDYMLDYWDAFGVEHEPGSGQALVLHPGEHMLQEHFPGLPAEGTTVTFRRSDALVHEDRLFLTWEHPMVRGAMEGLISSALGSAAFTVLDSGALPSGTLLLEMVFVLACSAPAELEARRYLPPTPIRLVLDRKGNDHAGQLPPERLQGRSLHRDRSTATAVIKSQSELLRGLMLQGEKEADRQAERIRSSALKAMQEELDEELARLRQLADDSAEEELLNLTTRRMVLEDYLRQAALRLDALRLIVRS